VAGLAARGALPVGPVAAAAGGATGIAAAAVSTDGGHPAWLRGGLLVALVASCGGLVALTVAAGSDTT
jgi:hypothetical protein